MRRGGTQRVLPAFSASSLSGITSTTTCPYPFCPFFSNPGSPSPGGPAGTPPVRLFFSNADLLWSNNFPRNRYVTAEGMDL